MSKVRVTVRFLVRQSTIGVFLCGVFFITTLLVAIAVYIKPNTYRLLEWLINYEGGFVRRGLTGQFALVLHDLAGITPTHTVFSLQIVAYGIFFLFSYRLLAWIKDRTPFILLIYSPFLFVFQIASWKAGSRKEILFFALLAVLANLFARSDSDRRRFLTLCIALALYPLLILCHEMLAFYLPYVLCFAALVHIDAARLLLIGTLAAFSVAAAGLMAHFSGSAEHVATICASLGEMIPPSATIQDCTTKENAISWLARDVAYGVRTVKFYLNSLLGSIGPALLLVGLGFLPVLAIVGNLSSREARLLVLATLASLTMSSALFVVAVDWGRFLYVHAVALSLILMTLAVQAEARNDDVRYRMPTIPVPAIAAYFLAWNLKGAVVIVGGGLVLNYVSRIIFGADFDVRVAGG